MKKYSLNAAHIFTLIILFFTTINLQAQVGINSDNSDPDASAMLDIKSTDKGVLIPRMSVAQREGISSPVKGLMVFVNDDNSFYFYNGSSWNKVGADDLGNHLATQNIQLNGNYLSADGDNEGIHINTDGDIGIGTFAVSSQKLLVDLPLGEFSLLGNTSSGGETTLGRFRGNPGNAPQIRLSEIGGTSWDIGLNDNNDFTFESSGTDQVLISPSGTVTADAFVGNGAGLFNVPGDDLGNHTATANIRLNDTWLTNSGVSSRGLKINNNGGISTYTVNDLPLNLQSGLDPLIRLSQDNSMGYDPYEWDIGGNHFDFYVRNTGGNGSSPFRINSNAIGDRIVIDADNVGIGTSSPTKRMDVDGQIRMRAGAGSGFIPVSDAAGTMTWTDPSTLGFIDNLGNHTATQTLNLNGNYLSGDGDNEGVFVDGNGNLGLGTNTPSGFFEMYGTGANSKIKFGGNGGDVHHFTSARDVVFNSDVSGSNAAFTFRSTNYNDLGNYTDHISILGNGNMGIGNAAPATKLDVAGTIKADFFSGDGSALTNIPGDDLGDHTASQNIKLNGKYLSGDGGNEGVFIADDGNVGIGTNNPNNNRLHIKTNSIYPILKVENTTGVNYSGAFVHIINNANNTFEWGINSSNHTAHPNASILNARGNSDMMTFEFDNVEKMRLTSDGRLGIGTTSPSHPLHVVGNAGKDTGVFWSIASDRRLKQNIQDYKEGLAEILKIRPVHFQYNEKSGYDIEQKHIGIIAQELQEIAPYMVTEFEKDGETYLEVNASAMIYMFVNAFQELNEQNEGFKKIIIQQEERITSLETQLQQIEALKATVQAMQAQMNASNSASTN